MIYQRGAAQLEYKSQTIGVRDAEIQVHGIFVIPDCQHVRFQ